MQWPSSLEQLELGDLFNQPIERVTWPDSLQQLSFGDAFDQAVRGVTWPTNLRQLTLASSFSYPLQLVSDWPAGLQVFNLLFWPEFYGHNLTLIRWPEGLTTLRLHPDFCLRDVTLPDGIDVIHAEE